MKILLISVNLNSCMSRSLSRSNFKNSRLGVSIHLRLNCTELIAEPGTKYHEKELANYFNVQYYGTLYLGSHLKPMTFIFDTGSSVS